MSWLTGAALVIAVSFAARHFSEAEQIARAAQQAQPWWLIVAVCLQLLTYVAQSGIWRDIARLGGGSLGWRESLRLSLAKLFVDQAVPTSGIAGTAALAKYLEQRGMRRPVVLAGVIVNLTSYFSTYVVLLVAAFFLLPLEGGAREAAIVVGSLFIGGSVALVAALFILPSRRGRFLRPLDRVRTIARAHAWLNEADKSLIRRPTLFLRSCGYQATIMLADATTLWTLVHAFGGEAPGLAVLASFMVANLFRSVGILPGGLGTFEASSIFTLHLAGVSLPAALSATLLFRALSFWLPMLPGAWASRTSFRTRGGVSGGPKIPSYWALPPEEIAARLASSPRGLSSEEAARRLLLHGANLLRTEHAASRREVLARQFANPLLLLLVFAAIVAGLTGELADACIVLTILLASAFIGYSREFRAQKAASALRDRLKTRANVLRDGIPVQRTVEEIVTGDVVLLAAGSLVPADAVVLEAVDCYVSEAVLTGESFPVTKSAGAVAADAPLSQRSNCVFLGTNVRSGTARCLVVDTGPATQYGAIAKRLTLRPPQTEFERGTRRFGYLLTSAMLVMTLAVFSVHMFAHRPVADSLLFAVALAVGLSPELLPAIFSVNLARGAEQMARHSVLVRHLNAIEDLGSMDVLCTDKTGTLTEGVISLEGSYDAQGHPAPEVVALAAINAALETGLASPLDEAIVATHPPELTSVRKAAEVPFDFIRKRVSTVVEREGRILLISKGAVTQVLDACATLADGRALDLGQRESLEKLVAEWNQRGMRVLAVATRELARQDDYGRDDERDLVFNGFLTFLDQPKTGAAEALKDLAALGVQVKVITGDARLVACHVAALVGLPSARVLSGAELDELNDEALWREAERTDLFVEVDPNQKERIILALKKMGHVVGFLGDGVNDAPAMHAADTSLSVEQAVDVAREAADFVLLERNLDVIRQGVESGRRTFANTLKYVLMTTSANLGNMASMAIASLFLPFLPLTAGQILLNNFLTDIPAVGLATDSVDRELVDHPRRWDVKLIGRFMVEFGLLSSLFDFLTFGVLLYGFQASVEEFRSGWFVESFLTELFVALVMRTRRPFYRSRPGNLLLGITLVLAVLAPAIPYLPFAADFGFTYMPATLMLAVCAITAAYVLATELLKRGFYAAAGDGVRA